MDGFTLLTVLDWLDLDDILNMAEVDPRQQETITKYYLLTKYKLNTTEISITVGNDTHMVHTDHGRFANGPDRVLFVLRVFGHIFGKLKINIHTNSQISMKMLSQHINQYCSNAEQEIVLIRSIAKHDSEFSFNDAEKVTLHWTMLYKNDNLWSNSFPAMEQLNIINPLSLTVLKYNFPHLTRFALRSRTDLSETPDLEAFIRLNPQLRSIEIPICRDQKLLHYINEMLPRLETLIIGKTSVALLPPQDVVHFKNVHHFSWTIPKLSTGSWDYMLTHRFESMWFENLKSITLNAEMPGAVSAHIRHIVRNKSLRKVQIVSCELIYGDLKAIVESLQELRELTIEWERIRTLGVVRRLLTEMTHLNTVNIGFVDGVDIAAENILGVIPSIWQWDGHVENIDGKRILSFTRITV